MLSIETKTGAVLDGYDGYDGYDATETTEASFDGMTATVTVSYVPSAVLYMLYVSHWTGTHFGTSALTVIG